EAASQRNLARENPSEKGLLRPRYRIFARRTSLTAQRDAIPAICRMTQDRPLLPSRYQGVAQSGIPHPTGPLSWHVTCWHAWKRGGGDAGYPPSPERVAASRNRSIEDILRAGWLRVAMQARSNR